MSTLTKHTIQQIFNSFSLQRILIIGDVMIDGYVFGKVSRISPEAPVPIVAIEKKEYRLGGAANVALNIKNLGAYPIICSVVGNDDAGAQYIKLMQEAGLSTQGIIVENQRPTTQKSRIISSGQQLMRIDEEIQTPVTESTHRLLLKKITDLLETDTIDAIVFEDYDKGVLTADFISAVLQLAKTHHVPTTVDPKQKHFNHYRGVSLFKPNFKELKEGLHISLEIPNEEQLSRAVLPFMRQQNIENMVVTLSEHGIFVQTPNKKQIIPTIERSIADVSGAGDTVISILTLGLAAQADLFLTASIANLAGGLVCESVGVIPIDKDALYTEVVTTLL